jgi:branched-chain amino acid transport system substrate-binding protein
MTQIPRLRRCAATTGLVLALALSACGGAPPAGSPTQPAPEATAAPVGAADAAAITDYRGYVGGTPGAADPTLAPIVIGWVNIEGGAIGPTPEATLGAQAAVEHVNQALGGIGGHPLELKVCTITSAEEEGQRCGQQLLNDPAVQAVAFGNVFLGDTSFNAVMAGQKPVLVGVATGPSVPTATNAFILHGDLTHVFAPWGTYARDVLNARTAAVIYTNVPGDKAAGAAVRAGLEDAGIEVTAVAFDPQSTDLLGPVTAAGAQSADVIVPISQGQGCVGIAKALTQLGNTRPVVATPVCLTPDVAQGLGGDLPTWTYGIAQTLPTDGAAPDVAVYLDAAEQAGLAAQDATKVWAGVAWGQILAYTKVLNAVGADNIDPATITEQLKRFTGPVVMGAPEVSCGQFADAPAVCNARAKFYTYQGQGVFSQVAGWLEPPA